MDQIPSDIVRPPQWSLDLGIAGRFFIWLAIAAFLYAAISWLLVPRLPKLLKSAKFSFTIGALSFFGTFICLAILFATNRLEFEYVWQHGDGSNPLQYRIAGIWSGQEGSFLLWGCTSALFGILSVRTTGIYRRWYTVAFATFLSSIAAILAYETPFNLNLLNGMPVIPLKGIGLAPSLINYWVVIHPPTIFMGFGSLTVLAAYAFSAMVKRNYIDWIPMVRPWALISVTLVGVGLCMGGFWAYETLGWGGFWMWDPVENVSFVPWVMTLSFVHGIVVQVTRKRWTNINLLLGGLPFLLFIYGTFLTRSGVLGDTSVHSFVDMNKIALKVLLGFLIGSSLVFLGLYVVRTVQFLRSNLEPDSPPKPIQREGFHRLGNILLAFLGFGAALGMSVPLFMHLAGQKPKVVDEAVYHQILTWAYVPLMFAMAVGPMLSWRSMPLREFMKRIFGVICVTLMLTGVAMFVLALSPWQRSFGAGKTNLPMHIQVGTEAWVLFLVSLSITVVVASGWRISELFKRSKMGVSSYIAHIGLATLMAGLIISRGLEQSARFTVLPGQPGRALGYDVTFVRQTSLSTDRENKVNFVLAKGKDVWTASPGFYNTRNQNDEIEPVTRPFILHKPFYDLYFALQAPQSLTGNITAGLHETVVIDRFVVTYEKMTKQGTPGTPGATFGAILHVKDGKKSFDVNPTIELTGGAMKQDPVDLAPNLSVALGRMDAANNSVQLNVEFKDAAYPVQLFYKPMTIFVWLGCGLMALGGFMSAWYRRGRKGGKPADESGDEGVVGAAKADLKEPVTSGLK